MTNYTVLGASGFIGRALCRLLDSQGVEYYAPERDLAEIYDRPLGKVFYCIGLTNDYHLDPMATIEAHSVLIGKILHQCDFEHIVYLSSTRLYDSCLDRLVDEDTPLRLNPADPRHLYDFSKGLGENLCLTYSADRACVARLSCVYSFDQEAPGFLSQLLQQVKTTDKLELATSPFFERDYVLIDDVLASLKAMLDQEITGIVNVCAGENTSNADLFAWIEAKTQCDIIAKLDTKLEKVTPVASTQRLYDLLNIKPILVADVLEQNL